MLWTQRRKIAFAVLVAIKIWGSFLLFVDSPLPNDLEEAVIGCINIAKRILTCTYSCPLLNDGMCSEKCIFR